MSLPEIFSQETSSNLLKNYSRYPVQFERGEGYFLYDSDGNEYLDFLSGIAVVGLGHNNKEINDAVINQVNKLWHVSNLFQSDLQERLATHLANKTDLDYTFFCNSGTEANEAAIKFARKWGEGRSKIICAKNSFHGRTLGSLSATGQEKLWDGFEPLTPGFSFAEYGNINDLINEYEKDPENTVAIILEPIQGESGIIVPPQDYLKKVDEFCKEKNLLFIVDEIQTGIGRTGKYFCYQWNDIKPDIVTTAKGIANGLPLGAVICNEKVASKIKPGDHGSTFGGNFIAVSAALAVSEILDDQLLQNIVVNGNAFKSSLVNLHSDKIKDVRGKGLMIGVELVEGISAKKVAKDLLDKKIVVGTSGDSVLRLLPPFIIDIEALLIFVSRLNDILMEY